MLTTIDASDGTYSATVTRPEKLTRRDGTTVDGFACKLLTSDSAQGLFEKLDAHLKEVSTRWNRCSLTSVLDDSGAVTITWNEKSPCTCGHSGCPAAPLITHKEPM